MKILFIFGTRPEAIKMAPLIKEFKRYPEDFEVKVCVTSQHKRMLDQVLDFFDIARDHDLQIMKKDQTLFDIIAGTMTGLDAVLTEEEPDSVIVQGDTSTAFAGALAGFYKKIHVAHVEAGLRSFQKYSPFPEEVNRVLVSRLADFHFTPTVSAKENLEAEGLETGVFVTGNTVIDALHLGLSILETSKSDFSGDFPGVDFNKRLILVTAHRRENLGEPLLNICSAIKHLANTNEDVQFVFPVHLNPKVRGPVFEQLSDHSRIHLCDPVDYKRLIWLLNKSYIVLTDSGGIQEEAPALGKPVLVLRDVTERPEGVDAGTAKLLGANKYLIIQNVTELLNNQEFYDTMSQAISPYGDGTTSRQIVDIYKNHYNTHEQ